MPTAGFGEKAGGAASAMKKAKKAKKTTSSSSSSGSSSSKSSSGTKKSSSSGSAPSTSTSKSPPPATPTTQTKSTAPSSPGTTTAKPASITDRAPAPRTTSGSSSSGQATPTYTPVQGPSAPPTTPTTPSSYNAPAPPTTPQAAPYTPYGAPPSASPSFSTTTTTSEEAERLALIKSVEEMLAGMSSLVTTNLLPQVQEQEKALVKEAAVEVGKFVIKNRGKDKIYWKDELLLQALKISGANRELFENGTAEEIANDLLDNIYSDEAKIEAMRPWLAEIMSESEDEYGILSYENPEKAPETPEERKQAAIDWLMADKSKGLSTDDKILIAENVAGLIPLISQDKVDTQGILTTIKDYLSLKTGNYDPSSAVRFSGTSDQDASLTDKALTAVGRLNPFASMVDLKDNPIAFKDMPLGRQKDALQEFTKYAIDNKVPPEVMFAMRKDLSDSIPDAMGRNAIDQYVNGGFIDNDIKKDSLWSLSHDTKQYLGTEQGQMIVGGGLVTVGAAAALLTGGVLAGGMALGTVTFGTTEFINYFGMAPFRDKSELQASGEWATDRSMQYDQVFKSADQNVYSVFGNKDTSNADNNLFNIDNAEKAVIQLEDTLKANYVYLASLGIYDSELLKLRNLKNTLQSNRNLFDSQGNYIARKAPPSSLIIENMSPGLSVREVGSDDVGGTNSEGKFITSTETKTVYVEVLDEDNNVLGMEEITLMPGKGDRTFNVDGFLGKQKQFGKKPAEHVIITVAPLPGQTSTIIDPMTGKTIITTKPVEVEAIVGQPINIKTEQSGYESKVKDFYVVKDGTTTFSTQLDRAFGSPAPGQQLTALQLNLRPDQMLIIDGENVDPARNQQTVWVKPGSHSYVILEEGREPLIDNIKTFGGQTYNVSGEGKLPYVPYEEEPGAYEMPMGGGGGYAPAPAPQTLINYGPACAGAQIWLDDVEVFPVLGTSYSITPGYHGVKVTKPGFKDWLKTINVFSGDNVTVSPQLEPIVVVPTQETTKRVWINSKGIDGAKILINGAWSGSWTPGYVDLARGLYKLTLAKSGYKDKYVPLWVGDVISYGDMALELARLAGVDINAY